MDDVDVDIRITHEETVKEAGRSTTRYWIDVDFGQKQWTVKRRFSECHELHKLLEKRFGKAIPRFPLELKSDPRQTSLSKQVR